MSRIGDEVTVSGQIKWQAGTGPFDKDGYYFNRNAGGFGTILSLWGINPEDLRVLADHLEMVRGKKEPGGSNMIERFATALVNIDGIIDPGELRIHLSPRSLKELEDTVKEAVTILENME